MHPGNDPSDPALEAPLTCRLDSVPQVHAEYRHEDCTLRRQEPRRLRQALDARRPLGTSEVELTVVQLIKKREVKGMVWDEL